MTMNYVGQVAEIRAGVAQCDADSKAIERAFLPVDEAKARLEEAIRRLASKVQFSGANYAGPAALPADRPPFRPTTAQNAPSSLGELLALGLLHLDVERITELAAARLVEFYHDVEPGLPSAERPAALAAIAAQKFELEEQEEAMIVQAEGNGVRIARRRDADPRAVVGGPDGAAKFERLREDAQQRRAALEDVEDRLGEARGWLRKCCTALDVATQSARPLNKPIPGDFQRNIAEAEVEVDRLTAERDRVTEDWQASSAILPQLAAFLRPTSTDSTGDTAIAKVA